MVDVTIVNNSDQVAALRIDDSIERGRDMVEHFKKMARQGDFQSVKVVPSPGSEPEPPKRATRTKAE